MIAIEIKMTQSLEDEIISFCTFRVEKRLFGSNILEVKEISEQRHITRIHHAPKQVEGYVNIRGQIHVILNLREILGLSSEFCAKNPSMVLFKERVGPDFGILVDEIGDITEVPSSQIEDRCGAVLSTPEGSERRSANVDQGICKLKNELLIILDSRSLLKQITVHKET